MPKKQRSNFYYVVAATTLMTFSYIGYKFIQGDLIDISNEIVQLNKKNKTINVVETYKNSEFKIKANSVEFDYSIDDFFGLYKIDDSMMYVCVDLTFENTGYSDIVLSYGDCACYADNQKCESKYNSTVSGDFYLETLSPGRSLSYKILFIVPKDSKSIEMEYSLYTQPDNIVTIKLK